MKSISIIYTIANLPPRMEKTPFSRETEMAQMSMLSEVEVWLSVNPLAEKYPGWSPYNYTLQNPAKLVDPDGRSVDLPDDWIKNLEIGQVVWVDASTVGASLITREKKK